MFCRLLLNDPESLKVKNLSSNFPKLPHGSDHSEQSIRLKFPFDSLVCLTCEDLDWWNELALVPATETVFDNSTFSVRDFWLRVNLLLQNL